MKIFCIGRNYVEHVKELNNEVPGSPVIFMKPHTALLTENKPFYYPNFSKDIHYECEIVLRICKNGKAVNEKFASRYYDAIALGIDFTARDLQEQQKQKGLPWEIAKAFDHSAVLGKWNPISDDDKDKPIHFHLEKNGEQVQKGDTSHMMYSFEKIIVEVSKFFSLNMGDIIYTGTPKGVGPIAIGDVLKGFIRDKEEFRFEVK